MTGSASSYIAEIRTPSPAAPCPTHPSNLTPPHPPNHRRDTSPEATGGDGCAMTSPLPLWEQWRYVGKV